MSLLDQVEQQVVNRLKELEPLIREYDQLRKVAERLGLKYSPGSDQSDDGATPATKPRRPGKRAAAAKRTARRPGKAKAARPRVAKPAAKPQGTRSTTTARTSASTQAADVSGTVAPVRPRKRAATSGRRAAARPGRRHDDVLRLVRENPGITVRETGERLGVDATGLYRVVKRLSDEGRVRKDGTRLQPVGSAKAATPKATTGITKPARAGTSAETREATRPSTTITTGADSRDG
jgi:Winged helix-turn-helix DNA-binding